MSTERGVPVRSVGELPVTPWRNGHGMTRPIASASDDEQPDWRISIATVTDGAAFSSFAGYSRAFTPLSTEGLTLRQDGSPLAADASGTVTFDGAAHVVARVLGAPVLAVNVMTRAGPRAQLHWLSVTGEYSSHDGGTRAVILTDGFVIAGDGTTFSAPAVIRPGTRVHCTRARLLEIRVSV